MAKHIYAMSWSSLHYAMKIQDHIGLGVTKVTLLYPDVFTSFKRQARVESHRETLILSCMYETKRCPFVENSILNKGVYVLMLKNILN